MSDDDEQRYVQHAVDIRSGESWYGRIFLAFCSCKWRSEASDGIGDAQAQWADHVREQGRDPLCASSRVGY